ncbi:MAG: serine hydrolase domain-containing protein [Bryobacteraceae bacterium]
MSESDRVPISRKRFFSTLGGSVVNLLHAQDGSISNLTAKLEETIPELLQTTGVPGLAVALIHDAQVVWNRGFGVKSADAKDPVDADTVFEAASLSKPAFGYVALKLVDTGELGLDTPLSEYLPAPFVPSEPRLKLITARMALSHTSGLPHGRPAGAPITLRFEPGSRFAYSATGFEYLRAVVERLRKQPLAELMKANLLDPFGMKHSSFGWLGRFEKNYAKGHARNGKMGLSGNGEYLDATDDEKRQMAKDYPEYRYPSAAAGMYTTAGDYAKFLCEIMQSNPDEYRLSPRGTAEMLKMNVKINDSIGWGLGWGLESTGAGDAFWHWGDWGVFRNFAIGYRRSRSGAVVLTNSFHGPKAYKKIVSTSTGGNHPAFSWVDEYRG